MITIKQALYDAITTLKTQNIVTAAVDARILLSHALNISQEELLIKFNNQLSPAQLSLFLYLLTRRLRYEPIAYIIEYKEFYGYNFMVSKDVLIPRAETELLIDEVLSLSTKFDKHINILDLGTGSGCIALSLLKSLPNAKAVATDISLNALRIAKTNAENLQLCSRINFIMSDWFTDVPKVQYDFILANPPYISMTDIDLVAEETKLHEPTRALFAQENGLNAYKQIALNGKDFLHANTRLLVEIGFNQAQTVSNIFNEAGYKIEFIKRDLAGLDRVICVTL